MVRITKNGGVVAAIEPAIGSFHYYPNDALNSLLKKFKSFVRVYEN